ncbi:MAG: T9SS type A sorting domain-containing protein [Saprospiraceae bacterium]|nr:T9SS type A sorting domain-containing protein [Saprospiraceae bacterium]
MKYFLLLTMLLIAQMSSGQNLSSSVIALAGGHTKSPGGLSLSWTVGEPVVDPIRSEKILLTQGFQQPSLKVATGFEDLTFGFGLQVFPNPVTHVLKMQSDYPEAIDFRLVDMTGKAIHKGSWTSEHSLDMSHLSAGMYALYYLAGGRMVRSELISKH